MIRAIGCWLLVATLGHAEPSAAWRSQRIEVTGVAAPESLRVVVAFGDDASMAKRPAIGGEWKTLEKQSFAFVPKYPLTPGGKYRVYFEAPASFADVVVPDTRDKTPPVLRQVFPSGDSIPENTLRFYLVFSKPMSRSEAYARVKILDEKGKAVDQPFLELDEELWDAGQTRLTLLIDPGRIKQEVKPRLDLGPVFQAGKKFTIVVDGRWPDTTGTMLGNEWRRQITATAPQTKAPSPKDWKITPPAAGRDSLIVSFPVAMDESLLSRTLSVVDASGSPIAGKATIDKHESRWSFAPDKPWKAGTQQIRLDWKLEDTCGNAIERPFEAEEIPQGLRPAAPTKFSLIPFKVGQ